MKAPASSAVADARRTTQITPHPDLAPVALQPLADWPPTGAWSAARTAEDMGATNMDSGKEPAKEPAAGMAKGAEKGAKKSARKLEIAVTDKGFEPDKVTVKKGSPVKLVFTRKTDQTGIKEMVLDTGGIKKFQKTIPLNTPVTIKTKFTKTRPRVPLQHEHVQRDGERSVRASGGARLAGLPSVDDAPALLETLGAPSRRSA